MFSHWIDTQSVWLGTYALAYVCVCGFAKQTLYKERIAPHINFQKSYLIGLNSTAELSVLQTSRLVVIKQTSPPHTSILQRWVKRHIKELSLSLYRRAIMTDPFSQNTPVSAATPLTNNLPDWRCRDAVWPRDTPIVRARTCVWHMQLLHVSVNFACSIKSVGGEPQCVKHIWLRLKSPAGGRYLREEG